MGNHDTKRMIKKGVPCFRQTEIVIHDPQIREQIDSSRENVILLQKYLPIVFQIYHILTP